MIIVKKKKSTVTADEGRNWDAAFQTPDVQKRVFLTHDLNWTGIPLLFRMRFIMAMYPFQNAGLPNMDFSQDILCNGLGRLLCPKISIWKLYPLSQSTVDIFTSYSCNLCKIHTEINIWISPWAAVLIEAFTEAFITIVIGWPVAVLLSSTSLLLGWVKCWGY